jgi:predicted Zn-dependent protease
MFKTILLGVVVLVPWISSCSALFFNVPTVHDEQVEQFVNAMGHEVVAVSEHRDRAARFRFRLADFARRDILGLSTGKQRIFISYELARLALNSNHHRWLLRHTLAHEIAHDVLGGDVPGPAASAASSGGLANRITGSDLGLSAQVRFRPYSRWAELAADRKAMEYWSRLGWDCENWVKLFRGFVARGYAGDDDHPTKERLDQATELCLDQQARGAATLQ